MVQNRKQLEYAAHAPAWHQKKRGRRAIVAVGLGLALLASLKWAGPAINHVQLLYYQHRCLASAPPAGKVVFDEAASRTIVAADWERFYALFSPPGGRFNATVFLGELRQRNGSPRLVAIDVQPRKNYDAPPAGAVDFDSQVIKPAGMWERPQSRASGSWVLGGRGISSTGDDPILRVYAGQRDAARADHFTITVDRASGRVVIDGWLKSDDTVLLEMREMAVSNAAE